MGLSHLPAELIIHIAEFLDHDSLVSFASCCRLLRSLAIELVFTEMYVFLERGSLEDNCAAVQDPILSRSCHSFYFLASRFDTDVWEEWERQRYRPWHFYSDVPKSHASQAIRNIVLNVDKILTYGDEEREAAILLSALEQRYAKFVEDEPSGTIPIDVSLSDHLTRAQYSRHWDRTKETSRLDFSARARRAARKNYRSLIDEQCELLRLRSVQLMLERIFRKSPNIDVVEYRISDMRTERFMRRKVFQYSLARPLRDARLSPSTEGYTAFVQMVLAAANAGISPKHLRLEKVEHTDFAMIHDENSSAWAVILRNVEVLLLELDFSRSWLYVDEDDNVDESANDEVYDTFTRERALAEVLDQAPNLKELTLSLWQTFEDEPLLPLHQVVGDAAWPNLTTLKLNMVVLDPDEFMRLISHWRQSLCRLELGNVAVTRKGWPKLFQRLAPETNLQVARLTGNFWGKTGLWLDELDHPRGKSRFYEKLEAYLVSDGSGPFPEGDGEKARTPPIDRTEYIARCVREAEEERAALELAEQAPKHVHELIDWDIMTEFDTDGENEDAEDEDEDEDGEAD